MSDSNLRVAVSDSELALDFGEVELPQEVPRNGAVQGSGIGASNAEDSVAEVSVAEVSVASSPPPIEASAAEAPVAGSPPPNEDPPAEAPVSNPTPPIEAPASNPIPPPDNINVESYDEDTIHTLEDLEAVRRRPGMYIGGTGVEGFAHLLWELIDNSVDEAAAGFCKTIDVKLHPDGSYEVADKGRGIPVGNHPTRNVSAVEVVFTELHAGGKFGSGAYGASGGLHGVGASVVNALSRKLAVEVDRDGRTHRLEFHGRIAGKKSDNKFKQSHHLKIGKKRFSKNITGTRVRYWPDREIFDPDVEISFEEVCERLKLACFLVPKLKVTAIDNRRGSDSELFEFQSRKGLVDYVEYLSSSLEASKQITRVLTCHRSETFEEKVDVSGKTQTVERTCEVDIAFKWVDSYETVIQSFVNTIPTPDGGTHLAGFDRALLFAVNNRLIAEAPKLAKLARTNTNRSVKEDIYEGLVAAIRVSFPEPQFQGQTKRQLGTPAIQKIVYDITRDNLLHWLEKEGPRSHVTALRDKISNAVLGRVSARQALETKRKAASLGSAAMPAKLADCRKPGEGSELVIVEGESAAGPAKLARNAEKVAILPLRGKVVNAAKSTDKQVLSNAEAQALFSAVGAGIGDEFNLENARYERVIILCDADVDGSHIRCLLLTLFYRYMSPLLEAGRIFAAQPPLFTTRAGDKIIRAFSEEERDAQTAKLIKGGRKAENIRWQRFKGLGEMNVDELAECALNPETRILKCITTDEAEQAVGIAEMFETLMGSDVESRRDYLIHNSNLIDQDALDV